MAARSTARRLASAARRTAKRARLRADATPARNAKTATTPTTACACLARRSSATTAKSAIPQNVSLAARVIRLCAESLPRRLCDGCIVRHDPRLCLHHERHFGNEAMRQMFAYGLPGKHGDKHIVFRGQKSARHVKLFRRQRLQTMRQLRRGRDRLRVFFGSGRGRQRRVQNA